MKRRKFRRIRDALLIISVIMAFIIFLFASIQMTLAAPISVFIWLASMVYILAFCWANEVE